MYLRIINYDISERSSSLGGPQNTMKCAAHSFIIISRGQLNHIEEFCKRVCYEDLIMCCVKKVADKEFDQLISHKLFFFYLSTYLSTYLFPNITNREMNSSIMILVVTFSKPKNSFRTKYTKNESTESVKYNFYSNEKYLK